MNIPAAPTIDFRNGQARKLLEAAVLGIDAQLRGFGRMRDRLASNGSDVEAHYRDLQSRRALMLSELRKSDVHSDPLPPLIRLDIPLLEAPLEPARWRPDLGTVYTGTSGVVQVAPPTDGTNVVASGKHPSSGKIDAIAGYHPGSVAFSGVLNVGPSSVPTQQVDPSLNYFWLQNWMYVVPFPPPTIRSRLTYRFDASAEARVFWGGLEASVMAFVSLGETANLTTGNDITVNLDGGWLLNADLTAPGPNYNGHYGIISGQANTVQRSFMVGAGQVPGVAIVVGAIAALSMMTEVRLTFGTHSTIAIGSQNALGRIAYHYAPELVIHV